MSETREAYRWCRALAREHYENFPVASLLLPGEIRDPIAAVYAFSRCADDFSDEGRHAAETPEEIARRIALLDGWERRLSECAKGRRPAGETHPAFVALADVLQQHDIPVELLRDLLKAYRMDVMKSRYETWQETLAYCRYSANPIGRIVLWLAGYRDEERARWSDSICTALQLTNFWQDLEVDWKKNRLYVPAEDLREFGYTEEDLTARVVNEPFRRLMARLCHRTRRLFEEGRPLIGSLGPDLRTQVSLTWAGGMGILRKLEEADYDVFRRRPSHSILDWLRFFLRAKLGFNGG